ncbi:hypothetical protein BS78_K057100 [Paspalum vaginatum]|uniref:Uncharacterized protein n=1 Tax=Paspalum vaginatum TaxID=158149 RepID=A0A9W7XCA0_9POAL|nr:hypothetical protein BS78_K057100 [Paspalum vaginatum]
MPISLTEPHPSPLVQSIHVAPSPGHNHPFRRFSPQPLPVVAHSRRDGRQIPPPHPTPIGRRSILSRCRPYSPGSCIQSPPTGSAPRLHPRLAPAPNPPPSDGISCCPSPSVVFSLLFSTAIGSSAVSKGRAAAAHPLRSAGIEGVQAALFEETIRAGGSILSSSGTQIGGWRSCSGQCRSHGGGWPGPLPWAGMMLFTLASLMGVNGGSALWLVQTCSNRHRLRCRFVRRPRLHAECNGKQTRQ